MLRRRLPRLAVLLALLLLGRVRPAAAGCGLDEALLEQVNRSIEACLVQRWDEALAGMDALVSADSTRPEPWFYRATVRAYRMTDAESFAREDLFYADLDSASARLDHPALDEPQRRFLEGSVLAWKAYQLGRRGDWWPALRAGLAGVRVLEALQEDCPDWADLKLGLGNYRFWRSVRLRSLDWLPFVDDERESSLELVREARAEGRFSPWVAAANLTWMLLEMGRPADCLAICAEGLAAWPGSRLFRWPQAEALLQAGRAAEADAVWAGLQKEAAEQEPPGRTNEFICLEKRSGAREELGDASGALELARLAAAVPLDAGQRKRLRERIERLEDRLARLQR